MAVRRRTRVIRVFPNEASLLRLTRALAQSATTTGWRVGPAADHAEVLREAVEALKARYRQGGLGDVVLKGRLEKVLLPLLEPIRARRAARARDPGEVLALVRHGSERAREVVASVLTDVRDAFLLNYEAGA